MNILKNLLCLFALLLCCWQPSMCSAMEQRTAEQPLDLETLSENCELSAKALETSMRELEEARQLLHQSEMELTGLIQELNSSEEICTELRQELAKLKAESAKLKSELSLLKASSVKASTELQEAEKLLNDTENKYQKEKKKLRRQNRIWQIIAVIACGIAVGK